MATRIRKIALGGSTGKATLVLPKQIQLRIEPIEQVEMATELLDEPLPTFDLETLAGALPGFDIEIELEAPPSIVLIGDRKE